MKKYLLNTMLLVAIASSANAQRTQFGLKAGANFANVETKDGPDFKYKPGFHGGLLAHIHVSDHIAVQPEVVYSLQGGKYETPLTETKLNLTYVNIPVQLQYMFSNGFRIQTGPQVGFLVNAETEINDEELDVKDDMNTTDFSWSLGVGYLTSTNLGFDVRYNHGLSNIFDVGTNTGKNRVFQVGLFYQFGPKK